MHTLKSRQEIAEILGISRRTLSRIIKRQGLDIPARRLLTPAEQRLIFAAVGLLFPTLPEPRT